MPKRKAESAEHRWKRKIKEYEHKLAGKRRRRRNVIVYSDDDDSQDDLEYYSDSGMAQPAGDGSQSPGGAPPEPEPAAEESGLAPRAADPASGEPAQQAADPAPAHPAPADPAAAEPAAADPAAADGVDPEFLSALGDFEGETAEWGSDINEYLAQRWLPILKDGLKKETKDELVKKYLLPKNCSLMKAPALNPEIGAVLNVSSRGRDAKLVKKQGQIGLALSVLGKVMTGMFTMTMETPDALRLLNDAAKFMADSHFAETETRRTLIVPIVDKDFIEQFKDRKRDDFLFGDKLGDFIKSSRGIRKSGQMMQSAHPAPNVNHLNPTAPPFRQQQQRGQRATARRAAGGPRATPQAPATYRRRAPAQARAPPPARAAALTSSPRRAAPAPRPPQRASR